MIKIELTNASNGVIKKVTDSQFNGADQNAEITTVYEIDEENVIEGYVAIVDLLIDISKDLGLELGSDFSPAQLQFNVTWGDKYNPSAEEVDLKLKLLRNEMKQWKEYKEVIERNPNVNSV